MERPEGTTAEEAAERHGGTLVDPGPYDNYEDAQDALMGLEEELGDEGRSDVPGTQALEGRYETDD